MVLNLENSMDMMIGAILVMSFITLIINITRLGFGTANVSSELKSGFGGVNQRLDSSVSPQMQRAVGREKRFNAMELELESNLMKLLEQIGSKIKNLKGSKGTEQDKEFVGKALDLIGKNIQNINGLEHDEAKGIEELKIDGKKYVELRKVINEENGLIWNLNIQLEELEESLNLEKPEFKVAENKIKVIRQIISILEKVNETEIKLLAKT